MTCSELLNYFKEVQGRNGRYMALCPVHKDRNPSLSITDKGDMTLINCHAGCKWEDILSAVGLKTSDVYAGSNSGKKDGDLLFVSEYIYTPTLRKVRYSQADGEKTFRWNHKENGTDVEWRSGANGQSFPLYNQSVLAKANQRDTVFLVEGEKDVDTLTEYGRIAVCSPNGATKGSQKGKWDSNHTSTLKGLNVVVIPDNDEVGKEFAMAVATELFGNVASLKVVDLSVKWDGLKEHGDISDVFEMRDDSQEVLDGLDELVKGTKEFNPRDFLLEPIPFDKVEIPDFPVECLPEVVSDFVKALSANTQTPLEMSGVLVLGVLAAAMQGKFTVQVKKDYIEQLSMYTVAVAETGERKSSVIKQTTSPLIEFEIAYNKKNAAKIKECESIKRVLEKNVAHLEKELSKDHDEGTERKLKDAVTKMVEFKGIKSLRLCVDDVTPEVLIDMLDNQGGTISICSAEGGMFASLSAKNDRGSSLVEPLLKGYSGDRLTVDRIGRGSNIVERPHISIILATQPTVLYEIMSNREFKGKGLTARFLFARCGSLIGERKAKSPIIHTFVKERYKDLIYNLLDCKFESVFYLSEEAETERQKFFDIVEKRLDNEWYYMRAFGAKFIGTTIRIAGLIHGAENYKDTYNEKYISGETFRRAIEIAEYLGKQAESIYLDNGLNEDVDNAKYIIRRLKTLESSSISKGDLKRLCQRFKTVDEMLPSLKLLEEHNYIKVKKETKGKGRPSETIFVNPKIE